MQTQKNKAFIIIILFTVFVLFSCNSGSQQPIQDQPAANIQETTTTSIQQTQTSKVTEEEKTTVTEKTVDFSLPYKGDPISLTAFIADFGYDEQTESNAYKVYKDTIGNINIKWEKVSFDDLDTKAVLYLNSGDMPDIMWWKIPNIIAQYMDSNLFLDYNKYSQYTPNWNEALATYPILKNLFTFTGENIMIPPIEQDVFKQGFIVNKTLLDKYDIPVPSSLEDMESGMKKLREADPSLTPFHTFWGLGYYMTAFGTTIDAKSSGIYFDIDSKTWKYGLFEKDAKRKELIQMLADYYANGYFNMEFSTMSGEQTKELFKSNKWGYTFNYGGELYNQYDVPLVEGNLPIEIETPAVIGASGVKPCVVLSQVPDNPSWAYLVSAKCANPELASGWVDAMLDRKLNEALQWGQEGVSFKVVDGQNEWIPEFLAKGADEKLKLGIWGIYGPRCIYRFDAYAQISQFAQDSKDMNNKIVAAIKRGDAIARYPRNMPRLTQEENDELAQIQNIANTLIDENEMKFVLGMRPVSEWNDFVESVRQAADINRALEIVNNAKQSPDRAQSDQRHYLENIR